MCGIAGIAALRDGAPPSRGAVSRMCDAIVHRGPDSEGLFVEDGVGLGARRLAIIDLEQGDQPLSSEDAGVVMVYNGEIYNYRELREELIRRGHRFRSHSDGEVLVHLWEERGEDFLEAVNGMFALALLDRRSRTLVLARDRVGIKPLYLARVGDHLVFGSEPKAVLASGLVDPTLDLDALRQFLAWEYVPPPQTLFREIRKLEPGEMLRASLETGDVRQWKYWTLPDPDPRAGDPRSDAEWEEAVEAQVGKAVQRQLVSDVPLGAFLSGGVDSSLVVSEMGPASTFSIGFDDPSYNELAWARKVAAHLGVSHTWEILSPDIEDLFHRLMPFMDDPIGDFSIFPTFLVSQLARRDVTVVLTGDGGDELFGGYDTYVAQGMAGIYDRVPGTVRRRLVEPLVGRLGPSPRKKGPVNKLRRFVEGCGYDPELRHARWRLFLDPAREGRLFAGAALEEMGTPVGAHIHRHFRDAALRDEVDRLLYVDFKSYLPENCLRKVDSMSMACSLEARVPLLDHEVVELAFRMPSRLKVRGRRTKPALKRVAATRVPRECVYRQKEGFSIPIKNWLAGPLLPLLRELLSTERLRAGGIFDPGTVQGLVTEHLEGRANHSHLLWSLMVFQDWRERWLS